LPETDGLLEGQVLRLQSGFYTVQTGRGEVTCQMRKRVKRALSGQEFIATGDLVKISVQEDGTGSIEEMLPRRSALVRLAPDPGRDATPGYACQC